MENEILNLKDSTDNAGTTNGTSDNIGDNAQVETKKKAVGRPRKVTPTTEDTTDKQTNGTTTQNGNNIKSFLSEYATETPTNTPTNTPQVTTENAPNDMLNYFSGALLLVIIDSVFPSVIAMGLKRYKPKAKVTVKSLQLDKDEKESLEPLADMFVKAYIKTLPPEQAFLIALIFIYGGKAIPFLVTD